MQKIYRAFNSMINYVKFSYARIPYNPIMQSQDSVCVILDKGMGDFILNSYYLEKIVEYYQNHDIEIKIIADTYNFEFLKSFASKVMENCLVLKTDSLEMIDGKSILDYRNCFSTALVPSYSLTPRIGLLLRALSPENILIENNNLFGRGYSLLDYKLFDKVTIMVPNMNFYTEMHKEFIEKITSQKYALKINKPRESKGRIVFTDYFVVNLDASNNRKLISAKQFLLIAKYFQKKLHLTPVLLGGKITKINDLGIDTSDMITNYIESKDMGVTVSLCRYAKFVVTSDTGIYHISVSQDVPTFIPTWSCPNYLFEPYPCALSDKPIYIRKYQNSKKCPYRVKCKINMFMKKCVPCVLELETNFIIQSIEDVLQNMLTR